VAKRSVSPRGAAQRRVPLRIDEGAGVSDMKAMRIRRIDSDDLSDD
jgi:hypothetical protein